MGKYLPPAMEEKEIESALTNKRFKVMKVANLKRRDNSASSVFTITVPRTGIEATYKVTNICGMRVTESRKVPTAEGGI
ncbi:hypothetical protein Trydic_g12903 [Trypoxylus dichotomus]